VRTFILDEADRMLDMGFVRDVRRILKLVPTERHSLLFSATMPDDIARLAAEFLKSPIRVEIARAGKTVDRVDQQVMFVPSAAKRDVLARLLQDAEMRRVIVFTRTKRGADRVCSAIEHIGVGVHAIHGNKSQGQRQAALESFRKGFTRVLVATDIAARGIDIDEITHVINYELPNVPESYVHRIGRTARAGADGVAIALCAPDEREYLRDIEKLTGRRLNVVASPGGVRLASDTNASEPDSESAPERREVPRHARPAPARGGRDDRAGASQRNGRHQGRPGERSARGGDRPQRDGDRPQRNGERPQGEGDRPQRNGGSQERGVTQGRNGGQQGRDGEHRGRNGARPGDRHGASPGARRDERSNGNGHRPAQGEARAAGANGSGREDAPQPWRNWTKGDGVSRQDGHRQDGQRPARPAKSRPQNRRGDGARGQGQGQGHHRSRDAR
jgi:ATP-dependent RNA helicase RhlE